MMKKISIPVLAVLLLGMIASACQPAAPTTVKIGLNIELSGSIPEVGKSSKNAAELAVKELNAAGGLDVSGKKYPVELVIEDNQDNKDTAVAAAQRLATAGVVAMIGPNASRDAIPAGIIAESNQMPMISPWSTNPTTTLNATGEPWKFVFRAAFIDDFQGVVVAKFAINQLKTTKPAVLYDVKSAYNKGIAEIYKKTLEENGVTVVAFESYNTGDTDFSKQLTRIKDAGADSLYLPNYYNEVPGQVKQAHALGYTGAILGSDSWNNPALLTQCGADCEGDYFTAHFATDIATPKAQAFIASYTAAYGGQPDDVAALTYDSFGLLFQAIKAVGSLDRMAIRNSLAGTSAFEGVTGNIQFKGSGDPVKSAVILQIKNGKFVYFATANP